MNRFKLLVEPVKILPLRLIILTVLLLIPAPLIAHGGGLNSEGCHNNRKTGDYHCHRSQKKNATDISESSIPTTPYRNCTEAKTLGGAPVKRGEPGYGPHLDRDNDGIGCE